MAEVMKALGISCKGLQNLHAVKTQVRTELNHLVENATPAYGRSGKNSPELPLRKFWKCNE